MNMPVTRPRAAVRQHVFLNDIPLLFQLDHVGKGAKNELIYIILFRVAPG